MAKRNVLSLHASRFVSHAHLMIPRSRTEDDILRSRPKQGVMTVTDQDVSFYLVANLLRVGLTLMPKTILCVQRCDQPREYRYLPAS